LLKTNNKNHGMMLPEQVRDVKARDGSGFWAIFLDLSFWRHIVVSYDGVKRPRQGRLSGVVCFVVLQKTPYVCGVRD
jgi:hypothetical protein